MTYLLDANVFIQAKNLHYGFDFCPAFWDWLINKNSANIVFSIEAIRKEIMTGNDDLSNWASSLGANFFLPPDNEMASAFKTVSLWANNQNYEQTAINDFFSVADFYLICHGLGHNMTIVTHERASTSTRKIKIPDACKGLQIQFMSPFEMLRQEQANFVLGTV